MSRSRTQLSWSSGSASSSITVSGATSPPESYAAVPDQVRADRCGQELQHDHEHQQRDVGQLVDPYECAESDEDQAERRRLGGRVHASEHVRQAQHADTAEQAEQAATISTPETVSVMLMRRAVR